MKHITALLFSLMCTSTFAQSVPFTFDQKFSQIDKDSAAYLRVGGEVRSQYFFYQHKDWGESLPDHDGFMLSRFLLHGDLRMGRYVTTFIQLQSGLSSGDPNPPPAVNQNPLDLHQLFIDIQLPLEKRSSFTIRLGRQELSYGSQRLVSLRDAPNNRQAFDGVKGIYDSKDIRFEGFYTNYVQARTGIFDDRPSTAIRFWGGYGTLKKQVLARHMDFYYLGIKKRSAFFDNEAGQETRHSVGTRWWDNSEQWQYDLEAVYQFGKMGSARISAYTISSNIAYRIKSAPLKPQIGVKSEVISGDRQYNDERLNTFNPLFPRGGYFGLAALIGPSNLFDIHPYIQFAILPHLTLTEDYDAFWRLNVNDGLYAISGKLLYSGKNTVSSYIGGQLGTNLEYNPTPFLYLRAEFTWFDSGKYLKEVGPGRDILMTGATVTYKF